MRPIAKLFSEYLAFATVDTNEYPQMPQAFGLANTRGLCLQNLHNGQIFHFKESEMSTDAVQRFIIAVSEGKAKSWNDEASKETKHDEL
jgi:protein disulfide-isomerase A1